MATKVDWAKMEKRARRALARRAAGATLTDQELFIMLAWACNTASAQVDSNTAALVPASN